MSLEEEMLMIIDFEADPNWGLEIWHPDYKLLSCDFLIFHPEKGRKELYVDDISKMRKYIKKGISDGYKIVCHNLHYEWSVCHQILGLDISNNAVDTMRLHSTVTGKKGKDASKSLVSAVEEYFGVKDYKDKYHQYLIDNEIASNKKEAKAKVGLLPPELLAEYNRADTEWTYKVYKHCIAKMDKLGIDWEPDHALYVGDVVRNCKAWLKGVRVDKQTVKDGLKSLILERDGYIRQFKETYAEEIKLAEKVLETGRIESDFNKRLEKSKTGKIAPPKENMHQPFNFNSTQQLAVLFMDVMGISAKILTEKGRPCFSKEFLHYWGDAGKLMRKWKVLNKPIDEAKKIIVHSSVDGRVHLFVSAGGTVTGRGTSSWN